MNCPECDHSNTEGAWLCINCGAKLPRADASESASEEDTSPEDQSEGSVRFEPTISENLRRLRERTRDQGRESPKGAPSGARGERNLPQATIPSFSGGNFLGLPGFVWVIFGSIFAISFMVFSGLQ